MSKKKKELIKDLENITISITYNCPNTGNSVTMSSASNYSSPISYHSAHGQYSEHTTWTDHWIEVENVCPECGEMHRMDL